MSVAPCKSVSGGCVSKDMMKRLLGMINKKISDFSLEILVLGKALVRTNIKDRSYSCLEYCILLDLKTTTDCGIIGTD